MTYVSAGGIILASHVNGLYDASKGKPRVRLIQQAAQSIANATDVALTFGAGSTDVDTHGFHSEVTNNTRVTPSIPGAYVFRVVGFMAAPGAGITYQILSVFVYKNGNVQTPRLRVAGPTAANVSGAAEVELTLTANGTTDFFEARILQQASTTAAYNTNVGGSFASVFECSFDRDL